MHTLYTVKKCKGKEFWKTSHGSHDGDVTICGLNLDHHWFITNNTFDGKISCRKCLSVLIARREENGR